MTERGPHNGPDGFSAGISVMSPLRGGSVGTAKSDRENEMIDVIRVLFSAEQRWLSTDSHVCMGQ